jgi:hypothetical protein
VRKTVRVIHKVITIVNNSTIFNIILRQGRREKWMAEAIKKIYMACLIDCESTVCRGLSGAPK